MYRILLLFFLCVTWLVPARSLAQSDSSAHIRKARDTAGHQLRVSFDLSRIDFNLAQNTRRSYEGAVDYYLHKELYLVAEGGAGSAEYDYPDLSYQTKSAFVRVGIDKTLLKRVNRSDWDAVFAGLRYGVAVIDRGDAAYSIVDSVWGTASGIIPAKTFTAHWAELTGGVRVELLPRFMLGWNVRGRFLLNGRSFRDLSPVYIAGYGRGDKGTVFDFSFYVCYALRWARR